jgi:hypothetical protein
MEDGMHVNRAGMENDVAKGRVRRFKRVAFFMLPVPVLALVLLPLVMNGDQPAALKVYQAEQARKPTVRRQAEQIFHGPFQQITGEQYATFMKGLNLDRDEDLFQWSQVTDIPVVALRKTSFFFRTNLHLMEDIDAAEQLSRRTAYKYKTLYDEKTGKIYLQDESGASVALRDLPRKLLMQKEWAGRFWHYRNFVDSAINYEAVGPFLIRFGDLPYRDALGDWIRKIPLNIVKTYRGKAIYLTNVPGRSFATTMPVSNTVYELHIGLMTGVWIYISRGGNERTEKNFIHEFGHVFDYVVLKGGYGNFRDNHQFPAFRNLFPEKQRVFGVRDDKVPDTPFGYITNYAKTNAQESFAEHFRAFILERDDFRTKADAEAAEGHPELMRKYRFMEKMMEDTSTRMVRLSTAFLEKETREKQNNR